MSIEAADYPLCSLPEMLRQCIAEHRHQTAIVGDQGDLTFGEFDAHSDAVAAHLQAQGIVKGDRVGLYCINSPEFAIAYYGIVKAGATVVPLNLLMNPKELVYILGDAGVRALFYHQMLAEAAAAIIAAVDHIEFAVCIGEPAAGAVGWAECLAAAGPPAAVNFDPVDDVVVLIYTSGTTGKPKGAMLTHRNLAANTSSIRIAMQLRPGKDILLTVLPMFHAFAATVGMHFPLLHGCTFVPVPKFDPQLVVDRIAAASATLFMGVPSMFNVLTRMGDDAVAKFATIRFTVSGGAAMPVELMKRFESKFGKLIYEGDGPTECSPVTCVNPIGQRRKAGSVGLPVPFVEMVILDDNGEELPHGEIGEICVRGPNIMKGYWRQPEETAASFIGGWFRTGDLGIEDDDGYFSIVDRKKDMVIVNGMNVYPRVVEEVLYQHDAVLEAAVVGEPSKSHGEIPVAYIALKPDAQVGEADIRSFCRDHLGQHEVPRKVFFLAALPKNATGKIVKRELARSGELERGVDLN